MASPLLVGSENWDSWFSSPSNTADTQPVPELDSMSFKNDMPSWSDLNSYQADSGDDMFGSGDGTFTSEYGGSGDGVADNGPMSDFLALGPEPQAATDVETYAGQDLIAQLPTKPSPPRIDSLVPSAENPCPRLETYCCIKPQYAPLFYVSKDSCKPCMTHPSDFGLHICVFIRH